MSISLTTSTHSPGIFTDKTRGRFHKTNELVIPYTETSKKDLTIGNNNSHNILSQKYTDINGRSTSLNERWQKPMRMFGQHRLTFTIYSIDRRATRHQNTYKRSLEENLNEIVYIFFSSVTIDSWHCKSVKRRDPAKRTSILQNLSRTLFQIYLHPRTIFLIESLQMYYQDNNVHK